MPYIAERCDGTFVNATWLYVSASKKMQVAHVMMFQSTYTRDGNYVLATSRPMRLASFCLSMNSCHVYKHSVILFSDKGLKHGRGAIIMKIVLRNKMLFTKLGCCSQKLDVVHKNRMLFIQTSTWVRQHLLNQCNFYTIQSPFTGDIKWIMNDERWISSLIHNPLSTGDIKWMNHEFLL